MVSVGSSVGAGATENCYAEGCVKGWLAVLLETA